MKRSLFFSRATTSSVVRALVASATMIGVIALFPVGATAAVTESGATTPTSTDPAATAPADPTSPDNSVATPDEDAVEIVEPPRRDRAAKRRAAKRREVRRSPAGTGGSTTGGAPTPKPTAGAADDPLGPDTERVGVPNFFLEKFRIPPFLMPIYEAAGTQYGVRWEILAAINEIETDYGRNLNISSAGALGWMQFMPATWEMYGVDANNDGEKDPFNPVDAIFAAARYLKAAGATEDIRRAIFAYNHADWYVDSVILRAKLISGLPDALVDSISGITRGQFPVFAQAHYAGAITERSATRARKVRVGENVARVVTARERRDSIKIYTKRNAPVVAVQDSLVVKIGASRKLGKYVVLQDGTGNRYRYGHLGSVARLYPVPRFKRNEVKPDRGGSVTSESETDVVPSPRLPASATDRKRGRPAVRKPGPTQPTTPVGQLPVKERLYANPNRKIPRQAASGAFDQYAGTGQALQGYETFKNYFSRPYGLKRDDVVLHRLRPGARLIGGTIIGRVGKAEFRSAPYVDFAIRPAGSGAPLIDPKPILDGWKLLETTALYRAIGVNPFVADGNQASIGQVLLMSKVELETYVLEDKGIDIYECGRRDIKAGRIDRRVLATLALLAASGLNPTVSSLTCGHGFYTSSGNVSHHSSGNAVDVAAINGVPIAGNQSPGGITEQAVRRLMGMQGALAPNQIISLLDLGGATLSMPDHADHIHVGFTPRYGTASTRIGKRGRSILRRSQWFKVFDRLGEIDNPAVPTKPSRYSLESRKGRKKRPYFD